MYLSSRLLPRTSEIESVTNHNERLSSLHTGSDSPTASNNLKWSPYRRVAEVVVENDSKTASRVCCGQRLDMNLTALLNHSEVLSDVLVLRFFKDLNSQSASKLAVYVKS